MVRGAWRATVHGVVKESDTLSNSVGTHACDHEGRVTDISFCALALTEVESHERRAVAGIWGDCEQFCTSTWEMHKHGRALSPLCRAGSKPDYRVVIQRAYHLNDLFFTLLS